MEVVENLPKRVVQLYRSMTVQQLLEWGFLDFVNRQWKEKIFSPVSGKNIPKIGKVLLTFVISLVSRILMIMDSAD